MEIDNTDLTHSENEHDVVQSTLSILHKHKPVKDEYGNSFIIVKYKDKKDYDLLTEYGLLVRLSSQKYFVPEVNIQVELEDGDIFINPYNYLEGRDNETDTLDWI